MSANVTARLNENGLITRRVEDARLVADLDGRYFLRKWANSEHSRAAPYCRAQRITANGVTFIGLGGGDRNDDVVLNLKHFGRLEGRIRRAIGTVIMMDIVMPDADRRNLAGKIRWLQRRAAFGGGENRRSARFKPKNANSRIVFDGGTVADCYLIDISSTGAAVAADVLPKIGTPLAIGRVVSKVVRHTDTGFAVQFYEQHQREAIEALLAVEDVELL